MENRPPEVIARLVRALVPPASREHVLGDLLERYESPRRYLLDALRALPYILASRLRRTTHPLGVLIVGAFLWYGVFWGNKQPGVAAALIPTLLTLATLALRDVYRVCASSWFRATLVDMSIAAAAVLVSQALLHFSAPSLTLTTETLFIGFPIGFVILFFVRLQSPTGYIQPSGFVRSISLQELRKEIATYEHIVRRAVHIEMGACVVVAVAFFATIWNATPLVARIGGAVTSAAAIFIAWFLYRYARVRPIPNDCGFAESLAAYRRDLERRRRLSNTYAWWYVLPLMSGIGLMVLGPLLQKPDGLMRALLGGLGLLGIGCVLVLVQQSVARRAQRRIEQLGMVDEKVLVT